jgi:membrane protease YdiL (CAAX protease family)
MDYFKIVENERKDQPLDLTYDTLTHQPPKQTWKSRLTFIWLLFLWLVSQNAIAIPLNRHGNFKIWKIGLFLLIFILCVWLSYRWAVKHGLIPKISRHYFDLDNIASGFGLMFASSMISGLIMMLTKTNGTENQELIDSIGKVLPPLVFFILTTSAGFFEELLFRVSLFELLLNKWPKLATCFAWGLFLLAHRPTDFASFMAYGLMSLVLTGLYVKYRNFYLNMSVHFLWNAFGIILSFLYK